MMTSHTKYKILALSAALMLTLSSNAHAWDSELLIQEDSTSGDTPEPPPKIANDYYDQGNAEGEKNNYADAILNYNQAIKLKPKFANAYNNRGAAKAGMNDFIGAISDYSEAIALNHKEAHFYYNRGIAKEQINDNAGAISDYGTAAKIDPYGRLGSTEAGGDTYYHKRAALKARMGDKAGAISDFNKAFEIQERAQAD